MMKDITITKVPSFNTAKRLSCEVPGRLNDKKLINDYAKICTIYYGGAANRLPSDYFIGATTHASIGKVPKDMWLLHNISTAKEDFYTEILKRNLQDSFIITCSLKEVVSL